MAGLNSVCVVSFLVFVSCLLGLSTSAKVEWKINLGGEPTDGFQAEEAVLNVDENLAKMRYHGLIKGTGTDLNVFKTQRFSRAEDLVLHFPVPDGVYTVTLMFAETWKGAYGSGNRVFDVYLGSKPGGIVKVIDQMDPFRSGGPAGPVRRKFSGIATQGGLTLALRPIKQNPQIAGIVINGYSYSNAYMEDLPTVPAGPFEGGDFASLDIIGPRPPADSSLLYDPSLNPKFKASNKPLPLGNSPSQAFTTTAQDASASPSSESSGPPALPNPFGTSQSAQSMPSTSDTNAGSVGGPDLSSQYSNTGYGAFGSTGTGAVGSTGTGAVGGIGTGAVGGTGTGAVGGTGIGAVGSPGTGAVAGAGTGVVGGTGTGAPSVLQSGQPQTVGAPAPVAVGSTSFGAPQGAMQYRSFRRRLASYYGEGTPVNFPFAPSGDVGHNEAIREQAAGNQAYADQLERVGEVSNQVDQPVAVNDLSKMSISLQDTVSQTPGSGDVQDTVHQTLGSGDGEHGSIGALPPPAIEDGMPPSLLDESSRTPASLELPREQEQAPAPREALSQMLPSSELQTSVNINNAHEDIATTFKSAEGFPSEKTSVPNGEGIGSFQERALPETGGGQYVSSISRGVPNVALAEQVQDGRETSVPNGEGIGSFQERALPETGGGQYVSSISRGVPNVALAEQVQDGREFRSGVSDLQRSSNIRSQRGMRAETLASDERQSRSPTDFMNGIRSQIQSLIRHTKSSDRIPEGPDDYSGVRRDTITSSPGLHPQETKRTFTPVERVSSRIGVSSPVDERRGLNLDGRDRGTENFLPSNSFNDRSSQLNSLQGMRSPPRRYAAGFEQRRDHLKFNEADLGAEYSTRFASVGSIDQRSSRQLRAPRSLNGISARQAEEEVPGLPGVSGSPSGSEDPSGVSEVPPSAGVHIGNGRLDGICIDNSTHCSCGMVNEEPKNCLYVAKEDAESMLCVRRPCNGKLICACAPGASSLCERSVVKDILVPATVHKHGETEEAEVVACRRENLEHGIHVLTPVV